MCLAHAPPDCHVAESSVVVILQQFICLKGRRRVIDVEPTVMVVIGHIAPMLPSSTPSAEKAALAVSATSSNFPLPEIVIKQVGTQVVGDENIRPAVVIVVRDDYTQPIEFVRVDSQFVGTVVKMAIASPK